MTVIPKFFFEQIFNNFSNLFYFILTMLQCIKILRVGGLYSYIFPLAFTLCLSAIKEFFDEYNKYLKDKEFNNQQYT